MAAHMLQLQRRILSAVLNHHPPSSSSLLTPTESIRRLIPSVSVLFAREGFLRRGVQSQTETPTFRRANEAGDSKTECNLSDVPSNTIINDGATPKQIDFSKFKSSPRHDRLMVFTCKVCNTRSMKSISIESYERGVVVARCDGCDNLHLIADRLGMFGKPGSVEEYLASRGEQVKKGSVDTLNLTMEDITGKKS